VPPSSGSSLVHQAAKRYPLLAGIQATIGNFKSAMELLKKQLAIHNFQPMKEAFIDSFTLSKIKFGTLPHLPAQEY